MVNPVSTTEMDPENLSKCSTGLLVSAEDSSETDYHVNQLEIEWKMPDGTAKVVKIPVTLCAPLCIVCF